MAEPRAIDLDLATEGYITGPNGEIHFVHGLQEIARDTARLGLQVCWDDDCAQRAGYCFLWQRVILMAPWLLHHYPCILRLVWCHELGHAVVGPSEERVRAWTQQRYRELLEPVWA